MILDIFDIAFIRIANIHSYSMAQYTDTLNTSGSFELDVDYTTDLKKYLFDAKYILFDREQMGIITSFDSNHAEDSQSHKIVIRGKMLKNVLSYRCFPKTQNYSGTITDVLQKMVVDNFISPADLTRQISMIALSNDTEYVPVTTELSKQCTAGSIEEAIQSICDANDMGYDLVPVISNIYNEDGSVKTNVSQMTFRVIKGKDLTINNTEGNTPVEFSLQLKNLLSSKYTKDSSGYKSMAYVAGEGEGKDRKIETTGETSLTGIDRKELYVDARDLQSQDADGDVMTEEKYRALLVTRGNEKLADCILSESFSAAVSTKSQFVYGVDYKKGDTVSIYDESLDLLVSALVISATISSLGQEDHIDITFGKPAVTSFQKLKKGGL